VNELEKMLWEALKESEVGVDKLCSMARDRAVRLLQGSSVRGREASEDGVLTDGSYCKLQ